MPIFDSDFKTTITIIATYLPIAGLILTFLLANTVFKKWKWLILSLAPLCIFAFICLVWGFWTSKVIFSRITDPFYISSLLFFFYLVGHYTYLLKRLIIYLLRRKKKILFLSSFF